MKYLAFRKIDKCASRWVKYVSFCCLCLIQSFQWPMAYLMMLSDWAMCCQADRHVIVMVNDLKWKHHSYMLVQNFKVLRCAPARLFLRKKGNLFNEHTCKERIIAVSVPCIAMPSAVMALTIYNKQVFGFNEEGFRLTESTHFWKMSKKANIFLCFLK